MTRLPVNDSDLQRLTDFHLSLFLWATEVKAEADDFRRNGLARQYEENYPLLSEHHIAPEQLLLKLRPKSQRLKRFADCISEASCEAGGESESVYGPGIFRAGMNQFASEWKTHQEDRFELGREELEQELIGRLLERAKENINVAATYRKRFTRAVSRVTRNTSFAGVLEDPHILDGLRWLAHVVADERTAPANGGAGPEPGERTDAALNALDESLVAYGVKTGGPDRLKELVAINRMLRAAIPKQLMPQPQPRVRYLRFEGTDSQQSNGRG